VNVASEEMAAVKRCPYKNMVFSDVRFTKTSDGKARWIL
jgi:hypothetical protein